MINLDECKKEIVFKLGSRVIAVREPTYLEQVEFEKKSKIVKEDDDASRDLLLEYLDMLGFEKKVAESLTVAQLQKVMESFTEPKK